MDMNREMKEDIMNQIDPTKVSKSFAFYVLGKLPIDTLYGFMEEYREHFEDFIRNNLVDDQPIHTGDELVNDKNNTDIEREIDQVSKRSMIDLEKWMVDMKITKEDWWEIFSEVAK